MPRGRVLAGAALEQATVGGPGSRRSQRQADDLAEPERGQVGQGDVAAFEHVAQGVGAAVAVDVGVGRLAGADPVEHAHQDLGHRPSSGRSAGPCGRGRGGAAPGCVL